MIISRSGGEIAAKTAIGFVADVVDCPDLRPASEKRSLRAFQNFHLLHVEQFDSRPAGPADGDIVVKHRNPRLCGGAHLVAGQSADNKAGPFGALHPDLHSGHKLRKMVEFGDVVIFQKIVVEHTHRNGDIQHLLLPLLRRYRDGVEADVVLVECKVEVILAHLQVKIDRFGFIPHKRNLDACDPGRQSVKKILTVFVGMNPLFGAHHHHTCAGKQVVVVVPDFSAQENRRLVLYHLLHIAVFPLHLFALFLLRVNFGNQHYNQKHK